MNDHERAKEETDKLREKHVEVQGQISSLPSQSATAGATMILGILIALASIAGTYGFMAGVPVLAGLAAVAVVWFLGNLRKSTHLAAAIGRLTQAEEAMVVFIGLMEGVEERLKEEGTE